MSAPPDDVPTRVILSDEEAVRYWTNRLGTSRERLAAVVAAVGDDVDAVATALDT